MSDVLRASEDLWAKSFVREGKIARWLVAQGDQVVRGMPIAEIRIGDKLHRAYATANGAINIRADQDSTIRPGGIMGFVAVQGWRRLATRGFELQALPLAS